MSHWWSSKPELILVQIWVVLILSHLVYALRERIALVADCDPVEVSGPYWWICCLGLAAPQRSSSTSSCKRVGSLASCVRARAWCWQCHR